MLNNNVESMQQDSYMVHYMMMKLILQIFYPMQIHKIMKIWMQQKDVMKIW